MKKILIISRLDVWYIGKKGVKTAGNQTMYNTIKGYMNNGFDVTLLTSGNEYIDYTGTDLDGLKVIRSKFVLVSKLKESVRNLLGKRKKNIKNNYVVGIEHRPYSNVLTLYMWTVFSLIEAFFYNLRYKADVFYGYEFSGVLTAYYLGKIFKKPVISRYQGTRLGFFLDNNEQFESCKDTIISMRTPVDLNIMGDDGTQGDLVFERLGVKSDKYRLWINGVSNKDQIYNLKKNINFKKVHNIPENSKLIVSSNRFDFWKRIDRLIGVFSNIVEKGNDVYLIIVGDGDNREDFEKLAKDLGVYNRIRFLGALPHKEALQTIREADIYMTLCDYTNLSNSVIEAQVMGIPVITLNVGGINKIIKNESNGYLYDIEEIETIPDGIQSLLSNKDVYQRMSEKSLSVGKNQLLSWEERMIKEVNEINSLILNLRK